MEAVTTLASSFSGAMLNTASLVQRTRATQAGFELVSLNNVSAENYPLALGRK